MPIYTGDRTITCLIAARVGAGYARREDAACVVPYGATTIGRHERGDIALQPRDITLYAAAYHAPALPLQYCRAICPIGRMADMPAMDEHPISLTALRLCNRIDRIADASKRLAHIAEDDVISADERDEYDCIVRDLRDVAAIYDDLRLQAGTPKREKPAHAADMYSRATR